jgi:hypothetical protein
VKYKITTLIDKTTSVKYKIIILIDNTTPVKYKITVPKKIGRGSGARLRALWVEGKVW